MSGWNVIPVEGDVRTDRVHVVPIDDLREHYLAPTCWCRPRQDAEEPSVFVHDSMDGRESHEQGRALH